MENTSGPTWEPNNIFQLDMTNQKVYFAVCWKTVTKSDCVTIHAHWHELPWGILYNGSNKSSVKIMSSRTTFIMLPLKKQHYFLKWPITFVSVRSLSHSSFLPAKSLHMLSDIFPISLNSPITQKPNIKHSAFPCFHLRSGYSAGLGAVTNTYRVARVWLAGAAEGEAALLPGFPQPGFLN